MVDILRKRAELLSGRRRQDVADEAEECAAGGKGKWVWSGMCIEYRDKRFAKVFFSVSLFSVGVSSSY